MASSTVTLPDWTCSVAVPMAVTVVSAPVTLKVCPLDDGDGLGLVAIGLADGDGEAAAEPPPEAPQAEMVAASATSASTRFKPAVSRQLCSWRYHGRLLDGPCGSASISSDGQRWRGEIQTPHTDSSFLGVPPAGPPGAAPEQEAEAEKDQDTAHRN